MPLEWVVLLLAAALLWAPSQWERLLLLVAPRVSGGCAWWCGRCPGLPAVGVMKGVEGVRGVAM
jgi:hypothetical protein